MRVAITGGTGMIGTALASVLQARGDDVLILTRGRPRADNHIKWDLNRGAHDVSRLEDVEVVFNLCGAPIGTRPWTTGRRAELYKSRIESTNAIVSSLQAVRAPVKHFIGAGGLGYFGDRGDEILEDDASPGNSGFLSELDQAWEQAHLTAASTLECRGAVVRMAVVLDPFGQTFPLMLQPFRLGIGGWLGDGSQYLPFTTIRDCVGAFMHVLNHPELTGGINSCVPEPPTNRDWSEALGRALDRKVRTHAPKWVLRGAFGELGESLFLHSVRAVPKKLLDSGYEFELPESEAAFRWLLEARNAG